VKKFNGFYWETVGQDTFSNSEAAYHSLAFPSSSDTPYVAYCDGSQESYSTVMKFNGNKWVTVGTDSFSEGNTVHLSLDFPYSSTIPHLAFEDNANNNGTTVMKFSNAPVDNSAEQTNLQPIAPIKITPNPFSSATQLVYQVGRSTTDVKVEIYDMQQQKIRSYTLKEKSPGVHRYNLSLPEISPGIYLLKVNYLAHSNVKTGKLVVTN
jgi:hypothetical protein